MSQRSMSSSKWNSGPKFSTGDIIFNHKYPSFILLILALNPRLPTYLLLHESSMTEQDRNFMDEYYELKN